MSAVHPEIITSTPHLARFVAEIGNEPVIACDLEADSLHHYQEKTCLIQIATPGRTAVVDPLAFTDLSPLAAICADPAVRKVFHGADYDIRSLYRDFAIEVNNLFDTMIACQFLGENEVGLAAVVRKRFGVELDKRFQKADWSKRPLTADMLAYAVEDTTLLIELQRQLEEELKAKGRLAWVEEEFALLSRVRAAARSAEPFYLRFKGAARMDPRTLAVLEELLRRRDERAKGADLPPFKVIGNDVLRETAEKKPRKAADLGTIPGFSAKLAERHGRWVLAAVAAGLALPAAELPSYPRPPRPEKEPDRDERLKRLKAWREAKARELGMEPGILANNALLEEVAEKVPRAAAELEAVDGMKGWQRKALGPELLALLARG
ncbi:MAG TPA: HRDC domain-containing protein [Geobacteraceae bacterium]